MADYAEEVALRGSLVVQLDLIIALATGGGGCSRAAGGAQDGQVSRRVLRDWNDLEKKLCDIKKMFSKTHLNTGQGLLPCQVGLLCTEHFRTTHDPQFLFDLQVVQVGDVQEEEQKVSLVHALCTPVFVEPVEGLQRTIIILMKITCETLKIWLLQLKNIMMMMMMMMMMMTLMKISPVRRWRCWRFWSQAHPTGCSSQSSRLLDALWSVTCRPPRTWFLNLEKWIWERATNVTFCCSSKRFDRTCEN